MAAKIIVVAGPNRGATYFLEEGENTFGRAPECTVVLASTQVSKRHVSITVQGPKAELKDLGSSNGTFVNGVLAKKKLLQTGDKISLGPFVLEVVLPQPVMVRPPESSFQHNLGSGDFQKVTIDPGQFKVEEEPKSLIGKYKKKFDDVFLPVLFDFYERTDYATLLASLFGIYVVVALGFTVYPVLQRSREEVVRQAEHQALYISNQVAYLNRPAILEGKEGALMTDFAESEVHVKEVVVVNLEGRIMAPGSRLNEAYNNPLFLRYRDQLQKNQNLWGKPRIVRRVDEEEIVAFTPIMVMSKTKGINVPGAVSVVIYSTSAIALDPGTVGTVYLEALFWSLLAGVVFLYLVYTVTHKPLHKLVDDLDSVLKGDAQTVEKKYKNDLIDQLIDEINTALGRIPKDTGGNQDQLDAGDTEQLIINNFMRTVEYLAGNSAHAMMMLDNEMRVKQVNPAFEELTGIRDAVGEVIDTVSRDESFPSLVKEMVGKSGDAGNEGVHEDYDFPVGTHKIHAFMISGMPGRTEGYLFLFEKTGD